MYQVRILVHGFVMGSTAYPKGSELAVNLPVYNYLTAEHKAELIGGDSSVDADEGYTRRDMKAEAKPRAKPKARRGRPASSKTKKVAQKA